MTLQVNLFAEIILGNLKSPGDHRSKVHSACLEHLAPTDGTPGIGNGCQIKLALNAAGDVNWRLGIEVDIGFCLPPIFCTTRFQLLLPVANPSFTKNLTGHRMHVKGPQIY